MDFGTGNQRETRPRQQGSPDLCLGRLGALLELVCKAALSAVLPVRVPSHEDTSTARLVGAFTSETLDLSVAIDLVEFQD